MDTWQRDTSWLSAMSSDAHETALSHFARPDRAGAVGFHAGVRGAFSQAIPGLLVLLRGSYTPSTAATYGPSAGMWASVTQRS
jgi:hypothetical protein